MLLKSIVIPAVLALGTLSLAGCGNMMGSDTTPSQPPTQTQSGQKLPVGGMGPAAAEGNVTGTGSGNITTQSGMGTGAATRTGAGMGAGTAAGPAQ